MLKKHEIFKYTIEQKVESISDVDWEMVLKQKPFLTKNQVHKVLTNARTTAKVQGPLYEQIAAFRRRIPIERPSVTKKAEELKREISQIYDMMKAKSK